MKSFVATAVLALVLASGGLAQYPYRPANPGTYPQPGVSPYLNLLRGGNPAINYYGLVRPQQEFRGAIQGLQQQGLESQANLDPTQPTGPGATGHIAYFGNLSHYYFNNPASGLQNRGGVASTNRSALQTQTTFNNPSGVSRGGFGTGLPGYTPTIPGGGQTPRRY